LTSGGNGTDADPQAVYEEISSAAYKDPIGARERFLAILRANPEFARDVLTLAKEPRDSRLRQVVARAVWKRPETEVIRDILLKWRDTEDDEFTLVAIKDALAEPGKKTGKTGRTYSTESLPDLLGTYRYVSSRLRHRVLNALPASDVLIEVLRREARKSNDQDTYARIAPILDDLFDALGHLEKAVEYEEDGEYFQFSAVNLREWVLDYRHRFNSEFGRVEVNVDFSACGETTINAAPFWIVTVFWNLWKNALDAVGEGCKITILGLRDTKNVRIIILDEGRGFKPEDQERAFTMSYSTKGADRGRGHMEVADAMRRLGGTAKIVPYKDTGYRIELTFPRCQR
jgi:signal transduction histidine kinase